MSVIVIKPNDFDVSKLNFSDIKIKEFTTKSGQVIKRKLAYVTYDGNKFGLQTPEMSLPFGLNENDKTDDKTGEVIGTDYSMNLSFRGMDRTEDENAKARKRAVQLKQFHSVLQQIYGKMKETALANSLAWIKKKTSSMDVVDALCNDIIKVSRDPETQEPDGRYPDTIKAKIIQYGGVFKTIMEDYSDQDAKEAFRKGCPDTLDIKENLHRGALVKSLIEFNEVWFIGGKFGMTAKSTKILLTKKSPNMSTGPSFVPSDDEDEDIGSSSVTQVQATKSVKVAVDEKDPLGDETITSSDDDDDEEEEAPRPPPKKKSSKGKA